MTPDLARLIANLAVTFRALSMESLYQVALALRHELARRDVDARPEADALVAALLVHARLEHRAIYSADCGESCAQVTARAMAQTDAPTPTPPDTGAGSVASFWRMIRELREPHSAAEQS